MSSVQKKWGMTQSLQADKCTQQTALSHRDTVMILLSHETLDKVTNGIESYELTFKPFDPSLPNWQSKDKWGCALPHRTALSNPLTSFLRITKRNPSQSVCPPAWHISLFFCGHTMSSRKQNELSPLLEGFSKQLRSIRCLYNEQSIIYSQYKHSQPWVKVKASEIQNVTNWAGALSAVGKKFLFQASAIIFLGRCTVKVFL